ncbi:hypothetical protein QE432_000661 [Agrobacterium sp. SORGH_AS 745]|nr:hypothetical protein [Agrobacterium sp. SORGH_AS_0745]
MQSFRFRLDALDGIDQAPPDRRQFVTTWISLEQLGFKREFQPVDVAGDGGVAGAQATRCR